MSEREGKKKNALKSLLFREQNRYDYRIIRTVYKGRISKGISHIEVPANDGTDKWITITDPVLITKFLIDRNIGHFGQAENTPFTNANLLDTFGYQGTNEQAEKLITRQQIPENTLTENKYTTAILQQLSDGNNIDNIPDVITFEELYSAMNKWNERTTTSPSGRHLGHYKILLRLPVYEENNPNLNISMKIFNVYHQVISIATKIGRTLSRWCNVTTCMIEKIKGSPKVDKLRVIHLYEADYNIIQKIIWARKTIWKAHNSDRLHEGQAGSRPNQRAIDVVIKKEMKI
jgi:hypothetical protein